MGENNKVLIEPFDYCTKCGLVYCHIQNFECVVCHGKLKPIRGLIIPDRVISEEEQEDENWEEFNHDYIEHYENLNG